jgi:endonuclease YncB( thermonuclease family)
MRYRLIIVLVAACGVGWSCASAPPAGSTASASAPAPPATAVTAIVPVPPAPPVAGDGPACGAAGAPVLVGRVTRVIDGDTVDVGLGSDPIRVRLSGADAPEHDQPWGPQAAAALQALTLGREVELEVVDQDRYERMVARVCLGNEDVGAWLIEQGDAWAYRQYLDDPTYCAFEGVARAARRGVWSAPPSQWIAPWEWRAVHAGRAASYTDYSGVTVASCVLQSESAGRHRNGTVRRSPQTTTGSGSPTQRPGPPLPPGPAAGCVIKGNLSSNGRIYHLPGSASYDATRIDTSTGERWFCSESEALAAGWRPARN